MTNKNNSFSIISCITKSSKGIGINGKIPWNLPKELKYFYKTTTNKNKMGIPNGLIMGRKTWDSLKKNNQPLIKRDNIVITHKNLNINNNNVTQVHTLDEALNYYYNKYGNIKTNTNKLFVIGGEFLYNKAINHENCEELLITEIDDSANPYKCDKYFPKIPNHFALINKITKKISNTGIKFKHLTYKNWKDPESEEKQYINLVNNIIKNGYNENGRNGEVRSLFGGTQHKFDLRKGFPLLTTKRIYFDKIIKELIFFMRGETNANILKDNSVNIWNQNTSRTFLDNKGLYNYSIGDMGPMYGWNWCHFGAQYTNCFTNYSGNGFDQFKSLFNQMMINPLSRRLLLSTYDPSKQKQCVLYPCHGLITQFKIIKSNNVDKQYFLDCKTYQRSVDVALGYPFNITSYALLMSIIAHINNLTPRYLFISLGDTHIYKNHLSKIKQQLSRVPLRFPELIINKKINVNENIDNKLNFLMSLLCSDFQIINYFYYPGIQFNMIP